MSFSLKSMEHAFSVVAQDVVKEAKVVADVLEKIGAQASTIEAVSGLVSPKAVEIERAAFQALGMVVKAVVDSGAAAGANGLNIVADVQTIADFKALADTLKAEFGKRGIAAK